jgi:glycosyltransferase involved in cell wall biosynthesis
LAGRSQTSVYCRPNMPSKKFLFISAYALYPPLLRVAQIVSQTYGLEGQVIAPEEVAIATVYHPAGKISARDFSQTSSPLSFSFLPAVRGSAVRYGFAAAPLTKVLRRLNPDYIWVHDEFTHHITLQILWHFRFNRTPRIVAHVAQNHTPGPHPLFSRKWPLVSRTRLKHLFLWPRLDGVMAIAGKSLECARRLGLPEKVPITVAFHPVFGPEDAVGEGILLPWSKERNFVVGFVGSLTAQKGWQVLLQAMEQLPEQFKLVLVGDGEQRHELEQWLRRPALRNRAWYAGLLAKGELLATYPRFDVLALPSLTTPDSVEQFGAVLAEAMAWGVPVIGSDSGGIPETIGQAGIIVPEGDAPALARALAGMPGDQELRHRQGTWGRKQFHEHYSCAAYARALAGMLGIHP